MPTPDLDRFSSRRSTVHGQRGVVATSQPLGAQVGISVLDDGGNAFDAAVATAAALNVVEPTSTGLGGDVFTLYRTADGDVGGMRACGPAPRDATVETVREAIAEEREIPPDRVEMPDTGPHTVTVPGTARGWETTIARFGEKTLGELLQPAIRYAIEGYPVSETVAEEWKQGEELFNHANARETYLFNDQAPAVGDTVRLPELGESLRRIAEKGADVVYEGEIANAIVDEVQSRGGFLSHEDLSGFEPEFIDPISTTYNGTEIYELPPNNQGPIVLEALNIAKKVGVGDYPIDSPERIHRLVESVKLAFHDGHYYITDPEFTSHPPLASDEWASKRAKSIGEKSNDDVSVGVSNGVAEDADTVLVTVADDEGNLVSLINSRFQGFGSGLVAGDTGIALQNRGASFTLDPEHPNVLEPGKRPFHTLIPALARFDEDDWAAFGVMGGYMQPQGQAQIISAIVDHNIPLQAALDRQRWRYRADGSLAIEPKFDLHIASKLVRRDHDIRLLTPDFFGGAQIVRNQQGTLSAATDPRKDGNAQGV